jgi:FkbM family methyltransferase
MSQLPPNTFSMTLDVLKIKGMRFSTVIDIGCADGSFFIDHFDAGILPGAKPLNIEANALYEDSLRGIKDVLGGDYVIAAVAEKPGEIELTNSVHPYWASIRPPGDPYWQRVSGLHTDTAKVQALTLDGIVQSRDMPGPYLLKMDVQGAEEAALAGASETLKQTDVVIVEADIADFQSINAAMIAADFSLYDVTATSRLHDGTLGWFYPVYLNNRRSDMKPGAFWQPAQDQQIIGLQVERRKALLSSNAMKLSKLRQIMKAK